MAPVTVASTSRIAHRSTGLLWQAHSVFANRLIGSYLRYGGTGFEIGNSSSYQKRAVKWTPSANDTVSEIRIAGWNIGSPTDNLEMIVVGHTGSGMGQPDLSNVLGTASNVYTDDTAGTGWMSFVFATPFDVTNSSPIWIVLSRSGSVDASNYYAWAYGSTGTFEGRAAYNGSTWTVIDTSSGMFQVLSEKPKALYVVTQDSGASPKVRIHKSTDWGANWSEQDSSNAPSAYNASYAFDATDTRSGPYLGVARFTGAKTVQVRTFNMATDTWSASDYGGGSEPAAFIYYININLNIDHQIMDDDCGACAVHGSSEADTADLVFTRAGDRSSAWSSATSLLAGSSSQESVLLDSAMDKTSPGRATRIYTDAANSDVSYRTLVLSSQGTQGDLDTTGADIGLGEVSTLTAQVFRNSSHVDQVLAAFIDADGTLEERLMTLESGTPGLATQHEISSSTSYADRFLSTTKHGSDLYVVATPSDSAIDYFVDADADGSWGSAQSWKTGLTTVRLSQAFAVPGGVGIIVCYAEDTTVKTDWLIGPNLPVSVSVPLMTATASPTAPGLKSIAKPPVSGASATGVAPLPLLRVPPPVATGDADAYPPVVTLQGPPVVVSPPVSTANAASQVPSLRARVAPPVATGSATAMSPSLRATLTPPIATATGLAYAPELLLGPVTVVVPLMTAAGELLAPSLAAGDVLLYVPVSTADGAMSAPVMRSTVPAALSTASASTVDPTLNILASPTVTQASAEALAPGVRTAMLVPVATASGQAHEPAVVIVVGDPVMTADGSLLTPVIVGSTLIEVVRGALSFDVAITAVLGLQSGIGPLLAVDLSAARAPLDFEAASHAAIIVDNDIGPVLAARVAMRGL